jgi:hypothetical protein
MEPVETPLDPIEVRRAEVAQYEQNIALYKTILASLPTEWPARLEQFKGSVNEHDDIAKVEDLDDVELLGKLWYADRVKKLIRTETVEFTKAKTILEVLDK